MERNNMKNKNKKLVHLFGGGKLYKKHKSKVQFHEGYLLMDGCDSYEIHEWVKRTNLEDWHIEPPKPKTVTLYRYLHQDPDEQCTEFSQWTSYPFDKWLEVMDWRGDLECLKVEEKKVEL